MRQVHGGATNAIVEHPGLGFLRAQADLMVWVMDCDGSPSKQQLQKLTMTVRTMNCAKKYCLDAVNPFINQKLEEKHGWEARHLCTEVLGHNIMSYC